jgi:transcriptional regulator with XRE-family HTH domain
MSLIEDVRTPTRSFGEHLRDWRRRRRLSQMDMALEAEISTRHLSFLETGRAKPSREMVLKLADRLEAPLRERNALLLAAGYAPVFGERGLDHPALENIRAAVSEWLAAHEPYPALAIDRRWTLVAANAAVAPLLDGVDPALLQPPLNVLRLSLHPGGLAKRIVNLAEWRTHLFHRLRRELDAGGDAELAALVSDLEALPGPPPRPGRDAVAEVLTPLVLEAPDGTVLSLITTTAVFGTALDVTVSELMLETLLPADPATRAWFASRGG